MRDLSLPDAPSCARNRDPILQHLRRLLTDRQRVLEVGSGTGQHAVYFAPHLPHLVWQTSEREEMLPGVRAWLASAPADNLCDPLALDVDTPWPALSVDTVFTANTLHIMPGESVEHFFQRLPSVLQPGGLLIVYGPLKIAGAFIGPSNADFDLWLKARNPLSGIRALEWLDQLAADAGFKREELNYLPANNQLVVWCRE
ncbi:DUF938 domain-containing protein [Microbulbifer sp. 2205BS26-8]|uniref:DUF938 domain-containing protein n=1 Tax=Microbulbifer sp. 2205BS26-8 TaxID=3064386 RepID=UPI00273E2E1E|nr:DUF938 domain-containing protein [Microbulbifer sp. 2205BS26-8]MDP5210861.1 DUF938 domain-containing protein [Microbulbifer sp. 2205BS26-8]